MSNPDSNEISINIVYALALGWIIVLIGGSTVVLGHGDRMPDRGRSCVVRLHLAAHRW